MSSGGTVDLFVDITALDQVQRELSTLISALVELGGRNTVRTDATAMGSSEVADAVNRFVAGWDEGRQLITENLRACQKFAAAAAQAYTKAETELQGSLQPRAKSDRSSAL